MIWDEIDKRTANVYGIYGNLGGGKTLTAVEIMVSALTTGWTVVSNVKLRESLISSLRGKYEYLDDFANVDCWKLPVGAPRGSPSSFRSCIVIDECAEFFDQYSSTSPQVRTFLSWLRHSSKRGQFVFLIVQKPEFIAKSLRLLINKWIVCTDMQQMKIPLFRIHPPFCGDFVMRRVFDRNGNLLSRGFNVANKSYIGRYYNTAQSIATEGRDVGEIEEGTPFYDFPSFLYPFVFAYAAFLLLWM